MANEKSISETELLTPVDLKEQYGIPINTQNKFRAKRYWDKYKFPFTKIGQKVVYRRIDVESWLASRTINSPQESE